MARSRKLPYENGDWIATPLRSGGYSIGLIAGSDRKGIALGYFFGPRLSDIPDVSYTMKLTPSAAVLVCRFGDLGLLDGGWTILGKFPDWSSSDWAIPSFARFSGIDDDLAWSVKYRDDLSLESEERISVEKAKKLPSNGLFSAGAVEIRLTKILSP